MMLMGIGMLVFWIAAVGLVGGGIWLLLRLATRAGNGGSGPVLPWSRSGPQASGREILQERYARGEINREQYLEMLSDLG